MKRYINYTILLVCLLAISQVYLYTMSPAFKSDDSPEISTSAYTLGINHPPGYPLFSLAGKVFSLLPVGSPAFRVSSFSVFLAMLVLSLSYFIARQIVFNFLGYENKTAGFSGVFILASSYVFWNQAIDAKGGIYILNLLFFSIMIFMGTQLFKKFSIKHLYMMAFIYGLSLANHWPSMIILLPVFGYFFYRYRGKINRKNMVWLLLLFVIGVSPYIYLPIRSGQEGVFIFMTKANTWESFWWTILRNIYNNDEMLSLQLFAVQIKEFLKIFSGDFSVLWILAFIGGYILFRKNRKIPVFYLSAFFITVIMVVFFNRTNSDTIWVMKNFLIPSQYILFIFIMAGICHVMNILDRKIYRYFFAIVLAGVILYSGAVHFKANYNRYNYITYDFGNNALMTLEPNSFYIAEGDFVMPLSYERMIEHKADNIDIFMLYNLKNKWGIADFIKKYGQIPLDPDNMGMNISNMINKYCGDKNVYFSQDDSMYLSGYPISCNFKGKGLLYKVTAKNDDMPMYIFREYSYRGIFETNNLYDKVIISNYSKKLARQAIVYLNEKKFYEGIKCLEYSLLFPENHYRADIYYDLSLAYKSVNDEDNQMKYLIKINGEYGSHWQAYETLGMIYLKNNLRLIAKKMFENAIKYGSPDKASLQQYIANIGNGDVQAQYGEIFDRAGALLDAGKYIRSMDLFDFLLERRYRTAEIYEKIGIYDYKREDLEEALGYFQKTKEAGDSAEIDAYIADTYYKLKQKDKAMAVLKAGMAAFGNEPKLMDIYNRIEKEVK